MHRQWLAKFRYAFGGLVAGMHKQNSFLVHLPVAVAVLILAAALRVELWGWCILILCIAMVLAAEMFNTSIEVLARRLHPERHADIGRALDVSAAAVLIIAAGAAVVGILIFADALLG